MATSNTSQDAVSHAEVPPLRSEAERLLASNQPNVSTVSSPHAQEDAESRIAVVAKPTPSAAAPTKQRRRRRYRIRSILNILGSTSFVAFYAFIVWDYLEKPAQSGIVESHFLSARLVFYLWFLLSVFALDWAHAGTAIVEVAAVASRHLAPKTAMQLMWHSERSWSGPTGWIKACCCAVLRLLFQRQKGTDATDRPTPAVLWWLLTLINLPLWVAVPLSGLSFDFGTASVTNAKTVPIVGVNQTTFEDRSPSFLWQTAMQRWSQGHTTTPPAPNVLYADETISEAGSTYYDYAIHNNDQRHSIAFFSGPTVSQRAQGRAWGLLVRVLAEAVPIEHLSMLTASSFKDWSATPSAVNSFHAEFDATYGCGSALLIASNTSLQPVYSDDAGKRVVEHISATKHEALEIILWQFYNESYVNATDSTVEAMLRDPLVTAQPIVGSGLNVDVSGQQNPVILSYGISLQIESTVGFADVSAKTSTFSNFVAEPSLPQVDEAQVLATLGTLVDCSSLAPELSNPGTNSSHSNAAQTAAYNECEQQVMVQNMLGQKLQASLINPLEQAGGRVLSLANLLFGGLACLKVDALIDQTTYTDLRSASCLNPWLVANIATGAKPYSIHENILVGVDADKKTYKTMPLPLLRLPPLEPARMRLSMLKLVGELAIAMTGPGPETYTGDMTGFTEVTILRPGVVSWVIVLTLLAVWNVLFVTATCVFFLDTRFAPTLGAYHLFRFGAEWKDELTDKMSDDFLESKQLAKIPTAVELENARMVEIYGFVGVTLNKQHIRLGQ